MKLTTLETPDGPFTLLAQAQAVLASGWTDQPEAVLGRLPPAGRPVTVPVVAPDAFEVRFATAAVTAYYDGFLEAIDSVAVSQAGTEFRHAGWQQLRAIPPGSPLSYAEFAAALGRPTAVRAAASICAANAAALFVPCHRVRRGDGSPGGFAWGVGVKTSLLARELAAG